MKRPLHFPFAFLRGATKAALQARAAALGWPSVTLVTGNTLLAGEDNWMRYLTGMSVEHAAWADAALLDLEAHR